MKDIFDYKEMIVAQIDTQRSNGYFNHYTADLLLANLNECSTKMLESSKTNPNMNLKQELDQLGDIFRLILENNHMEHNYKGYGEYMIPLSQEKALEYFDNGYPIYRIYPDDAEGMVVERSDIESGEYFYAVEICDIPQQDKTEAPVLQM